MTFSATVSEPHSGNSSVSEPHTCNASHNNSVNPKLALAQPYETNYTPGVPLL